MQKVSKPFNDGYEITSLKGKNKVDWQELANVSLVYVLLFGSLFVFGGNFISWLIG